MIDEGYIKLHRKMLTWEWYTDANTFRVFMHCLFMANWKDARFKGYEIPRGSFVTSYPQLARQTKLSVKNVRTALEHLKTTGEVAVKTTSQFSIITVNNYCKYQDDGTLNGRQSADERQAIGRQSATIEEIKEYKKERNISHDAREEEKHPYGINNNVYLSDGEMDELIRSYPDDYTDMIENLSTYMKSKGKYYPDHYETMMRWKRQDEKKAEEKKKNEFYDYRKDVV